MTERIFARVEDRTIVEYPLTIEIIATRNVPNDVYLECFYDDDDLPTIIPFSSKIEESPKFVGNAIYIRRRLVNKTVFELFDWLVANHGIDIEGHVVIDRTAITPSIYTAFEEIIKIHVQKMMDDFAMTRGYDNMFSLCDYRDSEVEKYRVEGLNGFYLRNQTWLLLTTYFEEVKNAQRNIPVNWDEVAAILPTYQWTN